MNARNISICELARAFPYEREFAGEEENAKLQIIEWEDTKLNIQ